MLTVNVVGNEMVLIAAPGDEILNVSTDLIDDDLNLDVRRKKEKTDIIEPRDEPSSTIEEKPQDVPDI